MTGPNAPRVERDAHGAPIREVLSDGTTLTRFDHYGRPTSGMTPGVGGAPPQAIAITYTPDGNARWVFADGTTLIRDPDGAVLRETTPDGAVFTSFDGAGRPTGGTLPGHDGGSPRQVSITYNANGGSVWSTDGGQTIRDAHGDVLKEITPDGWTFTEFDSANRPTAGSKGDTSVTISYRGDGSSVWTYPDGTTITHDSGGTVTQQTNPDGWTFTSFDHDGRPTAGVNSGRTVRIAYQDADISVWTYSDGETVRRDGDRIVEMRTPDGWTFTSFDDTGRPIAGTNSDGSKATITYQSNGNAVWDLGPGKSKITTDRNGKRLSIQDPDGWVYDTFDSQGRPTRGHNQKLNQDVDISYLPDGSVEQDFSNGSTLITTGKGVPTEQIIPDGKGGYTDIVFAVQLPLMQEVITKTKNAQEDIDGSLFSLKVSARDITEVWSSPAGRKYANLVDEVETVSRHFKDLFDEAVRRLEGTYQNYLATEGANYASLTPPPKSTWKHPPATQAGVRQPDFQSEASQPDSTDGGKT